MKSPSAGGWVWVTVPDSAGHFGTRGRRRSAERLTASLQRARMARGDETLKLSTKGEFRILTSETMRDSEEVALEERR